MKNGYQSINNNHEGKKTVALPPSAHLNGIHTRYSNEMFAILQIFNENHKGFDLIYRISQLLTIFWHIMYDKHRTCLMTNKNWNPFFYRDFASIFLCQNDYIFNPTSINTTRERHTTKEEKKELWSIFWDPWVVLMAHINISCIRYLYFECEDAEVESAEWIASMQRDTKRRWVLSDQYEFGNWLKCQLTWYAPKWYPDVLK